MWFPVLVGEGVSWPAPPALHGRSRVSFRGGGLSCALCSGARTPGGSVGRCVLLGVGEEQRGD